VRRVTAVEVKRGGGDSIVIIKENGGGPVGKEKIKKKTEAKSVD